MTPNSECVPSYAAFWSVTLSAVVLACGPTSKPAVEVLEAPRPAAVAPPSTCEPLPSNHVWKELYGATIALPEDWMDTTEYVFRAPNDTRLVWDADESVTDLRAFIVEKSADIAGAYGGSLGSPRTALDVRTPVGPAHYFLIVPPEPPRTLGVAGIEHPTSPALFKIMGMPAQVERLPDVLASLGSLDQRGTKEHPRYRVFDLSFAWDGPLRLPDSVRFESMERTRLLVAWNPKPGSDEFEWDRKFSFQEEPPPKRISLDERRIQGGVYCPPTNGAENALPWRSADFESREEIVEVTNYEGERRRLVYGAARTTVGSNTLELEYFAERSPVEESSEFSRLLSSVLTGPSLERTSDETSNPPEPPR